jgi:chemotaxis protein MotA
MDLATLLGLIIAVASVLVANMMEGGSLASLINTSAFILVVFGTLGATIISFSLQDTLAMPKLLMITLFNKQQNPLNVIDMLVSCAEKARREGLLVLQESLTGKEDPFLVRGMNLVIDGADPALVRGILETDLAFLERRHSTGAGVFETAGGYAPTMGIIGTVMGLVQVLGKLENPSELGPAIAVAFLATFYGIASANMLWLPLAAKLKLRNKGETLIKELMIEGMLSIQAGENPRIVREKLEAFLAPKFHREAKDAADAKEAKEQEAERKVG